MKSRRGVTLIEGMVATMILLIGMVGIFQGMIVASTQNSSANKRTRASAIATELASSIDQYGRLRTVQLASNVSGGTASPANSNVLSTAQWNALRDGLTGTFIFPDSTTPNTASTHALQMITPGFSTEDDKVFQRLVTVIGSGTDPTVTVVVRVSWNEAGRVKAVTRTTAFYNSAANLTGIEY